MEKLFIKNRDDKKISVMIERPDNPVGLAFVMHGLGGNKRAVYMDAMAKGFSNNNITVVRFDTINTYGDSGNSTENASITNHYEDLEDVIAWVKSQSWYQEPFWLAGLSLGAFCVTYFAQNHPEKVKALAPISVVVSGKLLFEAWGAEEMEKWKEAGVRQWNSRATPGLTKKIKYDFVDDGMRHELMPRADELKLPILMVIGEEDTVTPMKHQKTLFDRLPGKKEMHIINEARHNFPEELSLKQLTKIFDKWIKSL